MNFRDHFSDLSQKYSKFRPRYPDSLFLRLASLCNSHDLAWDCATGSGQAAINLADLFLKVIATDASDEQIANATEKDGITYSVAEADDSGLHEQTVDLITVAQALHWFDIRAFASEASRVLKQGGVLAAWTYNSVMINGAIDEHIDHLYSDILGPFWPPERQLVEDGYSGINLPFEEVDCPSFEMTAQWDLADLVGYLSSWSAVRNYEKTLGKNPLELVYESLSEAWGDPGDVHVIKWPLTTRVWRKTGNPSMQSDRPQAGR